MREMSGQARDTGPGAKPGEDELVGRYDDQAGQRHAQRVLVKDRDASQRQCEQDEIDRDTQDHIDNNNIENSE